MNMIVFGATGRTGRCEIDLELAQGNNLTAFARDPGKISSHKPGLKVVYGDVLDSAVVEESIAGHEAVLSALGG